MTLQSDFPRSTHKLHSFEAFPERLNLRRPLPSRSTTSQAPRFWRPVCPSTTMKMLHTVRETTWCQTFRQKPPTSRSGKTLVDWYQTLTDKH